MSKPETRFYTAVHKALPPRRRLHRQKMSGGTENGTADVWYSGNADDLWVEYKWIAKLTKKAPVRLERELSSLQQLWLTGRHAEGRNVVVILGTPEGAWICEGTSWREPIDPDVIRHRNMSKREVADYITTRTLLNDEVAYPRYPSKQSDLPFAFNDNDDSSLDPTGA